MHTLSTSSLLSPPDAFLPGEIVNLLLQSVAIRDKMIHVNKIR
jgi:hypothetical protein